MAGKFFGATFAAIADRALHHTFGANLCLAIYTSELAVTAIMFGHV